MFLRPPKNIGSTQILSNKDGIMKKSGMAKEVEERFTNEYDMESG
jgi:hypothetical protein